MSSSRIRFLVVAASLVISMTPAAGAAQANSDGWAGLYFGVHAGVVDDKTSYPQSGQLLGTPFSGTADVELIEDFGGIQVGYIGELRGRWLLGIEADYSFTPPGYSAATDLPGIDMVTGESFSTQFEVDHSLRGAGTVRASLGRDLGEWLLYASGGYAYGRQEYEVTARDRGFSQTVTDDESLSGWTVGAGVGYRLSKRLKLRAEYLFMDFGSSTIYSRDYNDIGVNAAARVDATPQVQQLRVGLSYQLKHAGRVE